jgi:hypothetical protein
MRFRQNFAVVTEGSPLYVQQIVKRSSSAETQVFRLFYKKFCRKGGEVSTVILSDKTACHAGCPQRTHGPLRRSSKPVFGLAENQRTLPQGHCFGVKRTGKPRAFLPPLKLRSYV